MLTKAIILGKEQNTNLYTIRIPLLETAASKDMFIIKATLCCDEGVLNPFNIGDVVYVGFQHNEYDSPVIIGKLSKEGLLGNERPVPNASYYINSLEVVSKTTLSKDVQIGEISYQDLYDLFQKVEDINSSLNELIWCEGREYKANNIAICNRFLYISKADHTSSKDNAPGNTGYWMQITSSVYL